MYLKILPITVLFCLFLNAIGKTLELTCYECSRGSAEGKDQLIDRSERTVLIVHNGSIEKNEYVLDTCGTDLCNNLALNQDNSTMPDDSFAAHKTINETMLLFLFVLSRL
ncbi:hypothetical protein M3Y97_00012800 [Aphelenchoides bicaudatus]|nr:hypothetical protein M3Y97_00012800 [Aphelenchoides bicaudatus]